MPARSIPINDLLKSPDEIVETLLPDIEDAKELVTRKDPTVEKFLSGSDRAAELLDAEVGTDEYFTKTDSLGSEITNETGTVSKLLEDPKAMDQWLIARTDIGREPLSVWSVGTIGTLFRTLILFFALNVPFIVYDIYTPSTGLLLLLGSLFAASIGYEFVQRVLSYDRPRIETDSDEPPSKRRLKRAVIANGVSVILLSEAFLRTPDSTAQFLRELGVMSVLLLLTAVLVGLVLAYFSGIWGAFAGVIGTLLVGSYLINVDSSGSWLEWAFPNSSAAHAIDIVLGLAMLVVLVITVLYALTYPRRIWLDTYSQRDANGIFPGFWTAITLSPMIGSAWIATQGGTLPGQTDGTSLTLLLFLLIIFPSLIGSAFIAQSGILSAGIER